MTRTKSTYLALLAVLLSPMAANADLIALFTDVNSTRSASAGRDQILSNLLGTGANVLVSDQTGGFNAAGGINVYYNGQAGVSSSLSVAELSSPSLTGVDLMFLSLGAGFGAIPYSSSEITAINSFVGGGGRLGISVEAVNLQSDSRIASVNNFLADLGTSFVLGTHTNRIPGGNTGSTIVLPTTLTAGVTSYDLQTFNPITGGIAAVQENGWAGIAFENRVTPVPEPGTLALLGIGLLGMGAARRRKNA